MNKAYLWITLTLLIFLSLGCKDTSKDTGVVKNISLIGKWHAPAYGIILSVELKKLTLYQITSNYCQPFQFSLKFKNFLASSKINKNGNTMQTTFDGLKQPAMELQRIEELPALCEYDLIKQKGDVGYEYNPHLALDIFWQTFNEYYAFFHLEPVNWDEAYMIANEAVSENTTEAELFSILSKMVAPLKDFHVQLNDEQLDLAFSVERKINIEQLLIDEFRLLNNIEGELTQEELEALAIYRDDELTKSHAAILSKMEDPHNVKSNTSKSVYWGMLQNNLGYLLITRMYGWDTENPTQSMEATLKIVNETLDQAFTHLRNAKGLVIDIRYNGGGDDYISQAIASRLISQDLHIYTKQARLGTTRTKQQRVVIKPNSRAGFTKPVALLTSQSTGSAAEIFALAVRARNNTRLFGEATAGGFSDTLPKSLPHGLTFSLSNEFYLSSDGFEFEGVGVPVNEAHPFFTKQQRDAVADDGLTAAITWLSSL